MRKKRADGLVDQEEALSHLPSRLREGLKPIKGRRGRRGKPLKDITELSPISPHSRGVAEQHVAALERLIVSKGRPAAELELPVAGKRLRRGAELLIDPAPGEELEVIEERDGEWWVEMPEGLAEEPTSLVADRWGYEGLENMENPAIRPLRAPSGAIKRSRQPERLERFVAAVLDTDDLDAAARKLGVGGNYMRMLIHDPRFQALYHERRKERLAMGVAYLQARFGAINKELVDMFFDRELNPAVRATIGLKLSERVQAQIDQEQRDLADRARLEEKKKEIAGKWGIDVTPEGERTDEGGESVPSS